MEVRKKNNLGVTLVEMLVVVAMGVLIATVTSGMFFTLLKSNVKSRILTEVKQNGNYALNVMERMIRNAVEITSYGSDFVEIRDKDNLTTIFSCQGNKISSNSADLINDKVKVADCSSIFTVTPGEAGLRPAVVQINFTLIQAGTASRAEESAQATFNAQVVLRNY